MAVYLAKWMARRFVCLYVNILPVFLFCRAQETEYKIIQNIS